MLKSTCLMIFNLVFLMIVIKEALAENIIDNNELNILILGDFGISSKKSTIKYNVVNSALNLHKIRNFDLGIEVGDNVYEYGITNTNYQKLTEIFTEDFKIQDFNFNFLIAAGNHDHYGDINAQSTFWQKIDSRFYYPNRYYDTYYRLKPNDVLVHFIVADSTPIIHSEFEGALGISDNKQLVELDQMFRNNTSSTYTFYISHHSPTRSVGPHIANQNNKLYPFCQKYHPTAILSGHDHNLQFFPKSENQECNQAIVGSSAKLNSYSSRDKATFYHYKSGGFATLNIKQSMCTLEFYSEHGDMLSSHILK